MKGFHYVLFSIESSLDVKGTHIADDFPTAVQEILTQHFPQSVADGMTFSATYAHYAPNYTTLTLWLSGGGFLSINDRGDY